MCLYPKFIINRKYTVPKKNGGNAPQTQSPHFMSISAALAQGAQIELMKAQANKANAEAENLRGVSPEFISTTSKIALRLLLEQ